MLASWASTCIQCYGECVAVEVDLDTLAFARADKAGKRSWDPPRRALKHSTWACWNVA